MQRADAGAAHKAGYWLRGSWQEPAIGCVILNVGQLLGALSRQTCLPGLGCCEWYLAVPSTCWCRSLGVHQPTFSEISPLANCLDHSNFFIWLLMKESLWEDLFNSPSQPYLIAPSPTQSPTTASSISCKEAFKATANSFGARSDVLPPRRTRILGTRSLHQTCVSKD